MSYLQDNCALSDLKFISSGKGNNYVPSRAMRMALNILSNIQTGKFDVTLPDGSLRRFEGKQTGPYAAIRIHRDRVARRFLTKGKLGFCEAYLDGDWSSPDLTALFDLFLKNTHYMHNTLQGRKWVRFLSYLMHIARPNSKSGSRKNIYAHYDIGNKFYESWLDPSMTYSSAYFGDGITDLYQAQERKYAEIVSRLNLKPEHHVLELGCGWGGFAEYAAKNVGCKVTAITISQAQYEYAVQRIHKTGLVDKVEIRLQDYRDVSGQFDRISSIEMFEAIGEKYWPVFFKKLDNLLKPGGQAVFQIITIKDKDFDSYRKSADYIQYYIFPGGMLPSKKALSKCLDKHGFIKGDTLCFGKDYACTLKIWSQRFQKAWPNLQSDKMNERFKRLWEQYLSYCEAGFRNGNIDVIMQTIKKPAQK